MCTYSYTLLRTPKLKAQQDMLQSFNDNNYKSPSEGISLAQIISNSLCT